MSKILIVIIVIIIYCFTGTKTIWVYSSPWRDQDEIICAILAYQLLPTQHILSGINQLNVSCCRHAMHLMHMPMV